MIEGRSLRLAVGLALVPALGLLILVLPRQRPASRDVRIVSLSVGGELALDADGRNRCRLVAVTADEDGDHSIFLEMIPLEYPTPPARLTRRQPLRLLDWTLRLLDVRPDSVRGEAVQLQWQSRNSRVPGAIVSAEEDVVSLTVDDIPLDIRVIGDIPAPGGGALELEVAGLPDGILRKRTTWGGTVPVGNMGEFRWVGTHERWVARIEIRPGIR